MPRPVSPGPPAAPRRRGCSSTGREGVSQPQQAAVHPARMSAELQTVVARFRC